VTLRLVERLDLEEPVEGPVNVFLHQFDGHDGAHPCAFVAGEVDRVPDGWLVAVFAFAEVVARWVAQLVPESHDRDAMSRTPW
jgi:hypothetical protein